MVLDLGPNIWLSSGEDPLAASHGTAESIRDCQQAHWLPLLATMGAPLS